jgi:HJR/Mrr/RecB family endonuclease
MKEIQMFEPMVNHLESQGYEILEQHKGHEHGTDLVAQKDGKQLLIELKGSSAAKDVDFGTVIYQIMKQMKISNDEYAIGVTDDYKNLVSRCMMPLQKLKIKMFMVSEIGVNPLW